MLPIPVILALVALIVLSAAAPKPHGWVSLGLAVVGLLATVLLATVLKWPL